MKKYYEAPSIEKVAFKYRDQVVVASGNYTHTCSFQHTNEVEGCTENSVIINNSQAVNN